MDYASALEYILSFADYERTPAVAYAAANFDLRRMEELAKRLGDPQLAVRSVHVAGTKGKGSTAAMIASALTAAGYRTGLYTSPHLHTMRERIQLDGEPISEAELANLVERLQPVIDEVNRDSGFGSVTTFEILTAIAFIYFRDRQVDFQVMEVGLGGRLDATNVIKPGVCVITTIGFDHMEVLGHTLTQIATEKAGIVKPRSMVVSSLQSPEVEAVIRETCQKKEARLIQVGREITWRKLSADLTGQSFTVKGLRDSYRLTIPLLGDYQVGNAATAVAALEVLGIDKQSIIRGLAAVRWPGRLEILRTHPWVVVDGAHNRDSAEKLGEALRQYFSFERLILVLGTSSDKDIPAIVGTLAPVADISIVTRSRHPRAASPENLNAEFVKVKAAVQIAEDVPAAIQQALALARPNDLICVTGSLFVVAEAREYFIDLHPDPPPCKMGYSKPSANLDKIRVGNI